MEKMNHCDGYFLKKRKSIANFKETKYIPKMGTIRIILVDDHQLVATGLKHLIHQEDGLQVVGLATSGREAITLLSKNSADLLITDLDMPDIDGFQLAEQAIRRFPALKIIVLSMHHSPALIDKARTIGISGFVSKEQDGKEIVKVIAEVMNGDSVFCKAGQKLTDADTAFPNRYSAIKELSQRELEVLGLLSRSMTSKEIADQLNVSELTISTHRRNIKRKLKVDRMADLIQIAMHYGLHSS